MARQPGRSEGPRLRSAGTAVDVRGLGSPWWLLGLVAVAAVAAFYVWMQRRRPSLAVLFANYDLLDAVVPRQRNRWRHVPTVLIAVALILLVIAAASPQGDYRVPRNRATVTLVIDVSRSMESTDVASGTKNAAATTLGTGSSREDY